LTVTWGAVTDAASYEVYYAADATAPGADAAAITTGVTISGTTATITGLDNGTSYNVYVRAVNAGGKSDWSEAKAGTPVVGTPVNITLLPGNSGELTVSWDAVTDATSYEVFYNTTGTAPTGSANATVTAPNATETLNPLTDGTVYYVWVRAKDSASTGAYSEPVAAAPYDPSELTNLAGPWVSSWGEEFTIVDGEFISAWGGSPLYKGTIVHIRKDDGSETAGYLTIRYIENAYYPNAAGNYYVIRWEKLVSNTTISIAAGWNSAAEEGFPTLAEAEAGYTGTIGSIGGSFEVGSDCVFTNVSSRPSAIQGSWTGGGGAVSNDLP
jgi:hypothetical protein